MLVSGSPGCSLIFPGCVFGVLVWLGVFYSPPLVVVYGFLVGSCPCLFLALVVALVLVRFGCAARRLPRLCSRHPVVLEWAGFDLHG